MRSRSVRRQLGFLTALGSAATLIVTVAGLLAIGAEQHEVAEIADVTSPAISLNAAVLQTMTNAETGLRGYVDSGDPTLLAPYNGAEQQSRAEEDALSALLASPQFSAPVRSANQREQAAQTAAVAQWWRYAATARAEGTHLPVGDVIGGKAIFDRVRAANAALAGNLGTVQSGLRAQSGRTLAISISGLVAATLVVIIAGFAVAARISRTVARPITRLRQVVLRQRQGDGDAHADEDSGPSEVRGLAVAFNEMTARMGELAAEQAEALRLQRAVFDAGRIIRAADTIQEAMAATCAQLGTALRARRTMAVLVDDAPNIAADAQWHVPGLADLPGVPRDVAPRVARMAQDLWNSSGRLVVSDILAGGIDDPEWARRIQQDTGARALLLVPVGLGSRAIGALYVLTDTGPRQWTEAEVGTVQQVAGYLGRAVVSSERQEQQAEYLRRLESLDRQKTEFLGTVSHELRTPLTSIQGYLELLRDEDAGPLNGEQQHMLTIIERNAVRLRGLIEDILVLNRIETGGLARGQSEVSLAAVAASTVEDLMPVAEKAGVRLRAAIAPGPAVVTGDRGQLQRALVNILSNAIKFTPRDGVVQLTCATDAAAGEVTVTCTDTGMGIPKADLEHLFSRFYRASNATRQAIPGTGLGLAIVKAIVDVHHGRLSLDSAEGQGTTVTLHLPLAGPEAGALPGPGQQGTST